MAYDFEKLLADEVKRGEALSAKIDQALAVRKTDAVAAPAVPTGAPYARKGVSALSSDGFSYLRLFGAICGHSEPEAAKHELNLCSRMKKALGNSAWSAERSTNYVAPFATSYLADSVVDKELIREAYQMVKAGGGGAVDYNELAYYAKKSGNAAYEQKAMSWIDQSLGGSMVGPPEFGELIDLARNESALLNAGAETIPLPPTGRINYPRQTTASTGGWLGENSNATPSTIGTGSMLLTAKKAMGVILFPNELLRFATVAAEQMTRKDLAISLNLTMDLALLEGGGGNNAPLGLINTPGIAAVTPTTVATDGNTMSPQDLYAFISAIEANNGKMTGFIMRPEYFWKFVQARAGVYNGSAVVANGQFTFNQFREMGQGFGKQIGGFPVTTTVQVSQTRVKGSGTNLTYALAGNWPDFLIAMFGGIEFREYKEGYTLGLADQTMIAAILSCDGGARHPGHFALADSLIMSSIGA